MELRGNQLTTLVETYPLEVKFNRWGVASSTMNFIMLYNNGAVVGQVAGRKQHPDFAWLKRSNATIRREEADHCAVSITFEGVPPETNEKIYSVSGSTSTEPIESHPDFAQIGGTPSNKLNEAQFDEDGKFKGFGVGPAGDNPKAGIKSYLVGSLIYQEDWIRGAIPSAPELDELGTINNPPPSPMKPSIGGRNWLLINADCKQIGNGSQLTRKWRLSGNRGWDEDIYQ